ncbi:MAG: C39 family peptidase [Candidatus Magasanikbacteria bacterium]
MKYNFLISLALALSLTPISLHAANLPVPFSSQAPQGRWVEPWKNACEEASTMLVDLFYYGYTSKQVDADGATKLISLLVKLENNHFGFNKDTNAVQITELINLYLPWEAYIVENPTLEQLKAEIDNGHPILFPVHGRDLRNPHYNTDQIDYHVFVISGYDDEKKEFIAQEVATQFGIDFRYSYDTIMTAMHDFLPRDKTYLGRKVAIFTRKELIDSGATDGDKDGLTKRDEIELGTILYYADSDGDGFNDGLEVANGYSPTVNETKLGNNALIKTNGSPDVFLLDNGKTQKIVSEQVLQNHGWKWQDVKTISKKFFETKLILGTDITE